MVDAPGSAASDRRALLFTAAWALATAVLLAVPAGPLGMRVLTAVVGWHVGALVVGRRDAAWRSAYALVAPMSVALVLPDQVLAVGLHTIVFPDTGAPFWGAVPVFMAGMWAIPLSAIVFVGRAQERSGGRAVLWATLVGLVLFAASEATSGVLPLWRATNVPVWGSLAPYVLPAEALLSAATLWADRASTGHPLLTRVVAGWLVALLYTGALAAGWLVLG